MLECVINVSEGRRVDVIQALAAAAAPSLLDVHSDADHNRSVLTVIGEEAARTVTRAAVQLIDIRDHRGVHPRFGAVDVVPFVPLGTATMIDATAARDRFAIWAADTLQVPSFLYGPNRSLPELRRSARDRHIPDVGPADPHPTAGVIAVGARPVLVAYNVWLSDPAIDLARRIASDLRGPAVRTLALMVGDRVQVSANLVDPLVVGPASLYDSVAARAGVARAELVGLIPRAALEQIPSDRWDELDVGHSRTIEARLAHIGILGMSPARDPSGGGTTPAG